MDISSTITTCTLEYAKPYLIEYSSTSWSSGTNILPSLSQLKPRGSWLLHVVTHFQQLIDGIAIPSARYLVDLSYSPVRVFHQSTGVIPVSSVVGYVLVCDAAA